MPDKLALSVTEAAQLLGVSRPTVYNLLAREDFPVFSVGNRRLISAEGLKEWVMAQPRKEENR